MAYCARSKLHFFTRLANFSAMSPRGEILSRKSSGLSPRADPSSVNACALLKANALHTSAPRLGDDIEIRIQTDYQTVALKGAEGDSILTVIKKSEYEFDGFGACDGTATCSTCHVYFDKATYDAVNKGISDEELDMLCIVEDKQSTSRLGCQVKLTKELNGMTAILPLLNP